MKRIMLVCLTFATLFSFNSFGQDLKAELALARFHSPDEGPYLETYLKMKGNSLKLKNTDEGSFAQIMITIKIQKATAVIYEDAYKLNGPLTSEGGVSIDFIDQQRIPLKNGKHELFMTIKDLNNPSGIEAKIVQEITIEPKLLNVHISDFQLVESYVKTEKENIFSKVGYDLVPFTTNFYPKSLNEISFYAEIYNSHRKSGKEGEFLVNMFIENAETGKIVGDLRKFMKRTGQLVVPVLHSFPLENVESGNYNLVLEARNRKNELLGKQVINFQRSNPVEAKPVVNDYVRTDADGMVDLSLTFVSKYNRPEELEEYLRCLYPISNQQEIHEVNRKTNFNDPDMMQRYMYYFWKQRDPVNPEEAWLTYWEEVQKVNENYGTNVTKGYNTDRGRVYLQYGPPNTISPNYFEPNTYPYEIWHYYVLNSPQNAPQSNRKFVFANIDLGTTEFNLIHSDAKNEISNRRWDYDLHKRSSANFDLDQENSGDHYGGRTRDFYANPH